MPPGTITLLGVILHAIIAIECNEMSIKYIRDRSSFLTEIKFFLSGE